MAGCSLSVVYMTITTSSVAFLDRSSNTQAWYAKTAAPMRNTKLKGLLRSITASMAIPAGTDPVQLYQFDRGAHHDVIEVLGCSMYQIDKSGLALAGIVHR
jgi:hypothetical protein